MLYATCHGSYTVRFHLRLDHQINYKALRRAVDQASARYPYLCVSIHKNEKECYYTKNDAPVAIGHSKSALKLGTAMANEHVWSVSYEGDNLYLDFFHGRTDGAGAYQLLATLLYYYLTEMGYDIDANGIRILDTPISEQEAHDPLENLPLIDLSTIHFPAPVTAFSLMKSSGLQKTENKGIIYRILVPESSFLPFTKENDASPGIMVSVLMARAIERIHPEHEEPIVSNYVVNARPMLNAPETLHNCTGSVTLNYDERIRNLPLDRQCTAYRGRTFIQSDKETVQGMMAVAASMAQTILDLPDLATKAAVAIKSMEGVYDAASYMVSYVGKWPYTQIGTHIWEFWTETPVGFFPLIEMAAVNGNICISIMQPFGEALYFRAFTEELEANGISYVECGSSAVSVADIVMD